MGPGWALSTWPRRGWVRQEGDQEAEGVGGRRGSLPPQIRMDFLSLTLFSYL